MVESVRAVPDSVKTSPNRFSNLIALPNPPNDGALHTLPYKFLAASSRDAEKLIVQVSHGKPKSVPDEA
ncbi:hypothetical protein [Streptomyces europaeiscabiei]|uniref:hypothetical protein n=1 Tax=Streptomyces europaeiscabiei TaxID=146819 RepID=UPI002E0D6E51|nr:hypothetical protein OHB30_42770 [Streptomyces europaeiscabiei]